LIPQTIVQTPTPARNLRFGDIPVDSRIAATLSALGYVSPTPIQVQAIPLLRLGRDVIGLACTGSGKTAGFGIPLIEAIHPNERRVQALILTPTRELALQVATALQTFGKSSGVQVAAVYGGVGMQGQINALRGNAHVVVGTPGRVLDHIGRGTLDLRQTRFVVLDEADRMLDVGFAPDIDKILSHVPQPRQTALFSATFPAEVETLARRHTREAVRVAVDAPGAALATLEERIVRVAAATEKVETLHDILIQSECQLALVFRRTTHKADKLMRDLEHRGFKVAVLHGRRSQAQREKALGALRAGQLDALVATDIAARGLDITGLTHVVNYDLPDTADAYTHRTGRTARMGAAGIAITLVAPEDEINLRSIQRKLPASHKGEAAPAAERPRREAAPGASRRSGPIARAVARAPRQHRPDVRNWDQLAAKPRNGSTTPAANQGTTGANGHTRGHFTHARSPRALPGTAAISR